MGPTIDAMVQMGTNKEFLELVTDNVAKFRQKLGLLQRKRAPSESSAVLTGNEVRRFYASFFLFIIITVSCNDY